MKKRITFTLMFSFVLLVFSIVNFFLIYNEQLPSILITGKALAGFVNISIESTKIITIDSPLSMNYSFGVGDNYSININVSANFSVDAWNYSVYDLKHGELVVGKQNVLFTPNSSFIAVRWGNRLTIAAHEVGKNWVTKTIDFYVDVPNTAPILGIVDSNIYVCEGESLKYLFNATDVDEEDLIPSISNKDPFYPVFISRTLNMSFLKIISGVLDKGDIGGAGSIFKTYIQNVSVVDGYSGHSDSAETNITIIEINNVPVLTGIGARTVYMTGENSTFFHQFDVNDVEDGVSSDGNMHFNLTSVGDYDFFSINSTGVVNYTPVSGHEGNSFALTVCVTDNALSSMYDNISLCFPRSNLNETVCDDFTITVTDENRAPEIVNYSPLISNFSVGGTTNTVFEVEVKDSDMAEGFYPDIDWYVDGVLSEHNEGKGVDEFNYVFGCGILGNHNVGVVVTDGLVETNMSWNIAVSVVACPVSSTEGGTSGGGGGSALASSCIETWVCGDWGVCQNAKKSFESGALSPEDYYDINEICAQNNYDERFCGFRITECKDLSGCDNVFYNIPRPKDIDVCYFTENPNCFDGITNCHNGECELLVDCGGPCDACPTCSDNEKNQGEDGVDCGGPCPYICDNNTFGEVGIIIIVLFVIVLVVFVIVLIKLVDIVRYLFFVSEKKNNSLNLYTF